MNPEAEAPLAVLRILARRAALGEPLEPCVELAKLALSGRLARCRSCGVLIVFLQSSKGSSVPVNADTVRADQFSFTPPDHVTHFATCPDAAAWRRKIKA